MERGKRQAMSSFFGGTGFYIALLLCVCVVGVAGYAWLFGGNDGVDETVPPDPMDSISVDVSQDTEPPVAVSGPVDDEAEEVMEPVTTVVMPEAETKEPESAPVMAEPPVLIVSPLLGETVTVFSAEMPLYNATTADWRTHEGIDITAAAGTAVVAASGGTVLSVEKDDRLGTTIVISHRDGYETTYASLQEDVMVAEGDYVSAGQKIAAVGNTTLTESALGAHLHFSVTKDGVSVNPDEFLEG